MNFKAELERNNMWITFEGPGKRGDWVIEQDEEMAVQIFRAYPNPFDGSIAFETHGIAGSRIAIHDMRGVLVETLTIQKDQTSVYLDGQQLSAGVYFAFLQEAGYPTQALKIIKY